jgi:hypothetical protein
MTAPTLVSSFQISVQFCSNGVTGTMAALKAGGLAGEVFISVLQIVLLAPGLASCYICIASGSLSQEITMRKPGRPRT